MHLVAQPVGRGNGFSAQPLGTLLERMEATSGQILSSFLSFFSVPNESLSERLAWKGFLCYPRKGSVGEAVLARLSLKQKSPPSEQMRIQVGEAVLARLSLKL